MYIMYVDESGDPGVYNSSPEHKNSKHYILSGLIIHQDDWLVCLNRLKKLRSDLKKVYKLPNLVEVHASELIRVGSIKAYRKIHKTQRMNILKTYMENIPIIFPKCKIINICLDKSMGSYQNTFQITAWQRLIERYDLFLKKTAKDKGIIISDAVQENEIRSLLRKMRIFNPVPSHYGGHYQHKTDSIIEDIITRDSRSSYFVQTVDVICYALYSKEFPKSSLKKWNVDKLFNYIQPLLLTEASKSDEFGIVRK